jgi:hypothetical protein
MSNTTNTSFGLGAALLGIGLAIGMLTALAATGAAALLMPETSNTKIFPAPAPLPPSSFAAGSPAPASVIEFELDDPTPPSTVAPPRARRVRRATAETSSTLDELRAADTHAQAARQTRR